MGLKFTQIVPPEGVEQKDWQNWHWQMRKSLKSLGDFEKVFILTDSERWAFKESAEIFKVQATPYYAELIKKSPVLRKIMLPQKEELSSGFQQMLDPLAEKNNNPAPRLIHRYSDRVLFLVTDLCSVYCRYCTRKHFTAQENNFIREPDYLQALKYIREHKGLREVILSGGDPLTLSDEVLFKIIKDIREIDHVEIIRIGSRMPIVNPMRITSEFVNNLKKFHPIFIMTHFNHPDELTEDASRALAKFVDNGFPVFNQMVLLNGVNNHAALIQALSRRLLYLRVKPYYMFQCDPSVGTDHLRTSIEDSLKIQKELWGHLSGLAMPQLSVDIPNGGGKAYYVPNFEVNHSSEIRNYIGWDGVQAEYISPPQSSIEKPTVEDKYIFEWEALVNAKSKTSQNQDFDK